MGGGAFGPQICWIAFGPVQIEGDRVYFRPWGAGLLDNWQRGWDRILFIILMLSTLAFDGLIATPLWQNVVSDLQPLWLPLGQWGFFAVRTFGLIDLTLLFLIVFVAFMRLVMYFGTVEVDALATTTVFGLTLVPIAWVYNFAHNYSYMVIQAQALFPLRLRLLYFPVRSSNRAESRRPAALQMGQLWRPPP